MPNASPNDGPTSTTPHRECGGCPVRVGQDHWRAKNFIFRLPMNYTTTAAALDGRQSDLCRKDLPVSVDREERGVLVRGARGFGPQALSSVRTGSWQAAARTAMTRTRQIAA